MYTVRIRQAAAAALLVLIAACGGGGGDGSSGGLGANNGGGNNGGGNPPGDVELVATQSNAEVLVGKVNEAVDTVVKAQAARGLPGASLFAALPTGVTSTSSQNCSILGAGGSGTYSYSITLNDQTFAPVSYQFSYNNCTYSYGGGTVTYNGSMSWNYTRYVSPTDYQVTYDYNVSYSYTGSLAPYSSSVTSSATCTESGAGLSCTYNVDGRRVSNDLQVSTSGTVTTVSRATVRIDGTAAAGEVTVVFSNWVYDSASRRARSGTITITDSNGNTAVITATGSGYTVRINYNGALTTYSV